MYILGVNSVYHESSACLVRDGVVLAAAEEERFNRVKHGKQARADNPDELPRAAIDFCLATAGITLADVDHVTVAADPEIIADVLAKGLPSPWDERDKQEQFLAKLPDIPLRFAELGFTGEFHWVAHHTAHAASAYFASTFDDAAVLVVDALGDDAFSTRFYRADGSKLECVQSVRYPASIGYLWELVSVYLGFGVYDAAKVMGLAAYGDPTRFAAAFDRLAWTTPDGGFDMATDLLRFADILYYPPSADTSGLVEVLGVEARSGDLEQVHQDVAAALQEKTNELVLHMTEHLRRLTGSTRLCLAGGVALNCVANQIAFERSDFEELYVQPAAHDGGLSVGAALHVWNHVLGQERSPSMPHAYWGPSFTDAEIAAELGKHPTLVVDQPADFAASVAELLVAGNVIGLFQGAMELGPRALGNRSIIGDPRERAMRETLNHKVKHREYFRPLAPSVLGEFVDEWFEVAKPTTAGDYMLMAYPARPEKYAQMGAVLHVDNTCRIQAVHEATNPGFHRIIREFHARTGVPMVLNTSFNDQEPIICTPADAVATFLKTEIDYLAIGPFLVRKSPTAQSVTA
ncbi:carbamoyltransferase family protein [Actinokineospora terrae]|uniref:Carbamoyltransferase n=1 Tax=Actinokineospora terrae TaxID=155974 RepID=A0A1H9NZF4_9PSEU|nr:carbamoyltransferase C-terminal domain-containing protein [Actinokineospora terrae]SER40959.1 carbamoyltransferase [Actinokineospora terrae]